MRIPIRVVKVGGSLFDLADLSDRLRRWLKQQSPAHHVLVAGGGALVEKVREWNKNEPIDDVAAHWMCIDLMTVTAHLLHARLPEVALVEDDLLLCQRVGFRDCTIFGPAAWMRHSESSLPGITLPANWEVSSDSIAARLAIVLHADEFVLLKSVLPADEIGNDMNALVGAGYVDPMMAQFAKELPPVRIVDFRLDQPAELQLRSQ